MKYIYNPFTEKLTPVSVVGGGVGSSSGFKNRIINGDLQVWQRGTSATYASDSAALTSSGNLYKTADRMISVNMKAGGQFTVSKQEINGFNSLRVTVDTPPDNLTWDGTNSRYWAPLWYRFEGHHLYDLVINKKTITISFLFKSNVGGNFSFCLASLSHYGQTKTYNPSLLDSYVTSFYYDGSEIEKRIIITITLDYNWSYGMFNDNKELFHFYICFLGDAYKTSTLNQWISGGAENTSSSGFLPITTNDQVNWALTPGNYVEFAQLQLEEGDMFTGFEHIPYDIQLLRCKRYYRLSSDNSYSYNDMIIDMRTTPTVIGSSAPYIFDAEL